MNAGLIDSKGKIIECPYYEIENLCKKIIEEYCSLSEENQNNFNDFAKDYTYFSPYFDFAVGVLGYDLVNPFFVQKTILCGNKEKRGFQRKGYSKVLDDYIALDYNKEYFHFSSDMDLQIKPFVQKDIFHKSYITPSLMEMIPLLHSQEFARQILNLGMIHSKQLCDEIQNLHEGEEINYIDVLMRYFPLIELDYNPSLKRNSLSFRSDNITMEQYELCNSIMQGKDIIVTDKKDLHQAKSWSHKFTKDEMIYLNKR